MQCIKLSVIKTVPYRTGRFDWFYCELGFNLETVFYKKDFATKRNVAKDSKRITKDLESVAKYLKNIAKDRYDVR